MEGVEAHSPDDRQQAAPLRLDRPACRETLAAEPEPEEPPRALASLPEDCVSISSSDGDSVLPDDDGLSSGNLSDSTDHTAAVAENRKTMRNAAAKKMRHRTVTAAGPTNSDNNVAKDLLERMMKFDAANSERYTANVLDKVRKGFFITESYAGSGAFSHILSEAHREAGEYIRHFADALICADTEESGPLMVYSVSEKSYIARMVLANHKERTRARHIFKNHLDWCDQVTKAKLLSIGRMVSQKGLEMMA